jgi:hypothetical protein
MINRAKMPRQLRNKGGIASIAPREKYGLGSKLKKRFRKLIPNELANVAVKTAPIVAAFNPAVGALMRGIGRFDQRGSISDALKQGIGTFAFGKAVGKLGGAESNPGFFGSQRFSMEGFKQGPIGSLFNRQAANKEMFGAGDALGGEMLTTGKKGILPAARDLVKAGFKALPKGIEGQLIAGGLTAGASLLASYFQGEFEEQQPGETMEEYLARRKKFVGEKMRTYMDSYFANDPEYMKLDDAGRDAFVARYNVRDGGRIGFQEGGIEERLEKLGGDVTSAEELLQGINQRLKTAESSLGSGGGGIGSFTPEVRPGGLTVTNLGQPLPVVARPIRPPGPFMGRPLFRPFLNRPLGTLEAIQPLKQLESFESSFDKKSPAEKLRIAQMRMAQQDVKPPEVEAFFAEVMRTQGETDKLYPTSTSLLQKFLPIQASAQDQQTQTPSLEELYPNTGVQLNAEPVPRGGFMFANRGMGGNPLQTALGFATGGMPTGIMRTNKVGVKERDYRETGGFVPVGVKEKADDVPAMLSKNEFVFTADAVRGAGNGSIEKGAQKMYDTMKRLEKRVV